MPMRALVQHRYGPVTSSVRVDELPLPRPEANEVRVRVRCAGINPLDWKLVEGQYKWMSRARPPCGVGFELAGEVHALGSGVTQFAVGTRVFGVIPAFSRPPAAIAQFAVVPAAMLVPLPDSVPFDIAATLPIAGLSALQLSRLANFQRGRKVLIHGASGGVGHLTVQMARNLGAQTTATASAANQAFLRSLRADHVIDYRTAPATWGGPFDAIVDCVTALSPRTVSALLADDGRYVATTPRFPRIVFDVLLNPARKRKRRVLMLKITHDDLRWLIEQCASGAVRPEVSRLFTLDSAIDALEASRSGRVRGKVAVHID